MHIKPPQLRLDAAKQTTLCRKLFAQKDPFPQVSCEKRSKIGTSYRVLIVSKIIAARGFLRAFKDCDPSAAEAPCSGHDIRLLALSVLDLQPPTPLSRNFERIALKRRKIC
ncbi:hypothetical protein ABW19_dt0208432 [Dactylella cylindrospora]|nr:hypothetical protein ABW19_dt0208432 [Dactylella cylindrospora]